MIDETSIMNPVDFSIPREVRKKIEADVKIKVGDLSRKLALIEMGILSIAIEEDLMEAYGMTRAQLMAFKSRHRKNIEELKESQVSTSYRVMQEVTNRMSDLEKFRALCEIGDADAILRMKEQMQFVESVLPAVKLKDLAEVVRDATTLSPSNQEGNGGGVKITINNPGMDAAQKALDERRRIAAAKAVIDVAPEPEPNK